MRPEVTRLLEIDESPTRHLEGVQSPQWTDVSLSKNSFLTQTLFTQTTSLCIHHGKRLLYMRRYVIPPPVSGFPPLRRLPPGFHQSHVLLFLWGFVAQPFPPTYPGITRVLTRGIASVGRLPCSRFLLLGLNPVLDSTLPTVSPPHRYDRPELGQSDRAVWQVQTDGAGVCWTLGAGGRGVTRVAALPPQGLSILEWRFIFTHFHSFSLISISLSPNPSSPPVPTLPTHSLTHLCLSLVP